MFYGCSFIYDGIPSEVYDLRILDFNSGGLEETPAGNEIELMQKFVYRKTKPYYFGRMQNIPLEFDLTIGSKEPISGETRNWIERWLLGRDNYKTFQIVQEDISDVIFYAMFTKSEISYLGNVQRGLTLHAQCNAPWGFQYPQILTKTWSGAVVVNENFTFNNMSADNDYLYPSSLVFTTSATGNGISLINGSDANREFAFTGISALETITVDNDKGILSSSTGLRRMPNFNRKFFRLVPGVNSLTLVGGLTSFSMTTTFAKKIGA